MDYQSSQLAQARQRWQSDWSQTVQSDDFASFAQVFEAKGGCAQTPWRLLECVTAKVLNTH